MKDKVVIGGIEYEPVAKDGTRTAIVVADRGYVFVGRISVVDNYVTIRNCSCVRRWGTTKGLGEIAAGGPTTKTVLDPQPVTRIHELQIVQIIDCAEQAWNL